jgi:hypothetical protein
MTYRRLAWLLVLTLLGAFSFPIADTRRSRAAKPPGRRAALPRRGETVDKATGTRRRSRGRSSPPEGDALRDFELRTVLPGSTPRPPRPRCSARVREGRGQPMLRGNAPTRRSELGVPGVDAASSACRARSRRASARLVAELTEDGTSRSRSTTSQHKATPTVDRTKLTGSASRRFGPVTRRVSLIGL